MTTTGGLCEWSSAGRRGGEDEEVDKIEDATKVPSAGEMEAFREKESPAFLMGSSSVRAADEDCGE